MTDSQANQVFSGAFPADKDQPNRPGAAKSGGKKEERAGRPGDDALGNLKDGFDLDGDAAWKSACAEGAASGDAVIDSKNIRKQLAASVDHQRLLIELGCAANEA